MNESVLVVDDEYHVRLLIRENLLRRGYKVTEAANGLDAMEKIKKSFPDLIILDLMMPEMDGIEVCQWVRKMREDVPIIVLSARSEEKLKVKALDSGADDFVTKPFGPEEFLARMRAVMRRMKLHEDPKIEKIVVDQMTIDLVSRRVSIGGRDLKLTRTEFALLAELAQNLEEIVTHDDLLVKVWGPEYRGSNHYLHVYLGRLRSKLGDEFRDYLETIPGEGYILHNTITAG